MQYTVYRDGYLLATSLETTYLDNSSEHDVLYCYTVTAMYDIGESGSTNEGCNMWMILPPGGLTAEAGDGVVHLEWFEPATDLCSDHFIPVLPYTDINTNIGAGDDWLVQGSQGADVAYSLTLPVSTTLTISLCSELTDFDTKLEIFTADFECIESTTGFYNDDNTCTSAPVGALASTLDPIPLSAGSYYIVVDGYNGSEGNYELTVSESDWEVGDCAAEAPYDDECYEYVITIDPYCCETSWDTLCESQYMDCLYGGYYSISDNFIEERINRNAFENFVFESNKSNEIIFFEDWIDNIVIDQAIERDLLGYNIYRDNAFLINVASDVYEYDDQNVINMNEYCYILTGVYDEGESPESNIACATPIPGDAPMGLSVSGGAGYVQLEWDPGSEGILSYNIYRDNSLLTNTDDIMFNDETAIHDVEYCYTVTGLYPSGESFPSNQSCGMWMILPPADLEANAGDGYVDLSWDSPSQFGSSDLTGTWNLTYDWYCSGVPGGPMAVEFYEDGTGIVEGFPVVWGEGGAVDLADGLCPGVGEYNYSAYFLFPGYSTYYYFTMDGDYGEGYMDDGYTAGSSLDGITTLTRIDFRENINTSSSRTLTDVISVLSNFEIPMTDIDINHTHNRETRELLYWKIYRDNALIDSVGADIFTYRDEPLENMIEYCYTLSGQYSEGESPASDIACATPIPGEDPTGLFAMGGAGYIGIEWSGGGPNLQEFIIYRNGEAIATTTDNVYEDHDAMHDVEYCYIVTGLYPSGESFPSNEFCSMWVLGAPINLSI